MAGFSITNFFALIRQYSNMAAGIISRIALAIMLDLKENMSIPRGMYIDAAIITRQGSIIPLALVFERKTRLITDEITWQINREIPAPM